MSNEKYLVPCATFRRKSYFMDLKKTARATGSYFRWGLTFQIVEYLYTEILVHDMSAEIYEGIGEIPYACPPESERPFIRKKMAMFFR